MHRCFRNGYWHFFCIKTKKILFVLTFLTIMWQLTVWVMCISAKSMKQSFPRKKFEPVVIQSSFRVKMKSKNFFCSVLVKHTLRCIHKYGWLVLKVVSNTASKQKLLVFLVFIVLYLWDYTNVMLVSTLFFNYLHEALFNRIWSLFIVLQFTTLCPWELTKKIVLITKGCCKSLLTLWTASESRIFHI